MFNLRPHLDNDSHVDQYRERQRLAMIDKRNRDAFKSFDRRARSR